MALAHQVVFAGDDQRRDDDPRYDFIGQIRLEDHRSHLKAR